MYIFSPSKKFNKSFLKIRKHKKYKEGEFIFVLNTLLSGKKLSQKYKVHKLNGKYENCFECHIQNDILMIYIFDEKHKVLYAIDIGTHSELF